MSSAAIGAGVARRLRRSSRNGRAAPAPFPRIKYNDALARYGSGQTRSANPLVNRPDVSAVFAGSNFARSSASSTARCCPARSRPGFRIAAALFFRARWMPGESEWPPGLGTSRWKEQSGSSRRGPIANNLTADELAEIRRLAGVRRG